MAESRRATWGDPNWSWETRMWAINGAGTNMPDVSYQGAEWENSRFTNQAKFQDQLQKDRAFMNKVGKKAKPPATFGPMGWAFTGIDTVMNMKQGDSFGTAAFKGVASGMLWTTMPGIMTAHMLATSAPGVVSAVNQYKRQKELWWNQAHRGNFGGNYVDTRRAQTMRQAALEAIQGSKLNARSALGGEARILNQNMYRG